MLKIEKVFVGSEFDLTRLEEVHSEEKYFTENGSREDWSYFLDQYKFDKFSKKAAKYLLENIPHDLNGTIKVAENFDEPTEEKLAEYRDYCQIVNNVFIG